MSVRMGCGMRYEGRYMIMMTRKPFGRVNHQMPSLRSALTLFCYASIASGHTMTVTTSSMFPCTAVTASY